MLSNVKLTTEKLSTAGSFCETMKIWLDAAAGSFDFMNTLKKISVLCKFEHIQKQANGYIAGTSVPRVCTTAYTLYKSIKTYRQDKVVSIQRGADVVHQTFDFAAAFSYTTAFFRTKPTTSLNAGAFMNCAADAADVVSFSDQVCKGWDRQSKLAAACPVLQKANKNVLVYTLLKLVKSVTAFVAGVFACFVLLGTALVCPVFAVTVALTSSIFNILAYYHRNYWCDTFLKFDYLPVK